MLCSIICLKYIKEFQVTILVLVSANYYLLLSLKVQTEEKVGPLISLVLGIYQRIFLISKES